MSTTVRREVGPRIDEDGILSRLVTSGDLLVVCDFVGALCATGDKINEALPGKRALRVMSDLAGLPCTSVAILASDFAARLRRSEALSQRVTVVQTCTADADDQPTDPAVLALSKVLAIDALLTTHSPDLIFFAGADDYAETVFAALGVDDIGCRVGERNTCAPARLRNPTELVEFLERLYRGRRSSLAPVGI